MLTLYPTEIIVIQQIIERSRREEEMIIIDSKTAAVNIMLYLTEEGLLTGKVIPLTIEEVKEDVKEVCY